MTLFTKSIYLPRHLTDGLRVSIMSRHTLTDGKTPDLRITPDSYDAWFRGLAHPDTLVGAWYRGTLTWDVFTRRYLDSLLRPESKIALHSLLHLIHSYDLTLLCAEAQGEPCHRHLLAQRCQELEPRLEVVHI